MYFVHPSLFWLSLAAIILHEIHHVLERKKWRLERKHARMVLAQALKNMGGVFTLPNAADDVSTAIGILSGPKDQMDLGGKP